MKLKDLNNDMSSELARPRFEPQNCETSSLPTPKIHATCDRWAAGAPLPRHLLSHLAVAIATNTHAGRYMSCSKGNVYRIMPGRPPGLVWKRIVKTWSECDHQSCCTTYRDITISSILYRSAYPTRHQSDSKLSHFEHWHRQQTSNRDLEDLITSCQT